MAAALAAAVVVATVLGVVGLTWNVRDEAGRVSGVGGAAQGSGDLTVSSGTDGTRFRTSALLRVDPTSQHAAYAHGLDPTSVATATEQVDY